jgi:ubiquinone/menaquinone biosynthesis C-methylase UbiE
MTRAVTYAANYARLWEPVLAPAGHRLLDALEPFAASIRDEATIVDVGSGTGLLALEATRRWPHARIVAVDPSAEMRSVAWHAAEAAGIGDGRLQLLEGKADRLPLADGMASLVISSFVYQIVPDRLAALREARRVVRPGGVVGYVTWLQTDVVPEPRQILEEELGSLDRWSASAAGAGDVPSLNAAVRELRRAGFVRPRAWAEELHKEWMVDDYLEYFETCWPGPLAGFDADGRCAVLDRIRARLTTRFPAQAHLSWPIVFAVGFTPP